MTSIPAHYYLYLAVVLFCSGLLIVLIKRSAIFVLMGIELMLNAAHVNFAVYSTGDPKMEGQIMVIFTVVLAAAEVAIALAILLHLSKQYKSVDFDDITDLKH